MLVTDPNMSLTTIRCSTNLPNAKELLPDFRWHLNNLKLTRVGSGLVAHYFLLIKRKLCILRTAKVHLKRRDSQKRLSTNLSLITRDLRSVVILTVVLVNFFLKGLSSVRIRGVSRRQRCRICH